MISAGDSALEDGVWLEGLPVPVHSLYTEVWSIGIHPSIAEIDCFHILVQIYKSMTVALWQFSRDTLLWSTLPDITEVSCDMDTFLWTPGQFTLK